MPIPFILGAGAAIAAAAGTKKAVDAKNDTNEAKNLNQKAALIAQSAEKNIENRKKRANRSIENLGRKKIEVDEKWDMYKIIESLYTFKFIK